MKPLKWCAALAYLAFIVGVWIDSGPAGGLIAAGIFGLVITGVLALAKVLRNDD